ncbi:U-box domain-containing protein 44 [Spatholobus suberectus]|nr:U-box domain-containing protein 44 [Spatholobus suberectus]
MKILITLTDTVEGNARNKEKVAESQGWDHIISCLGSDSSISEAAIDLLYELLQEQSGWNQYLCKKLSENRTAVCSLVALLKNPFNHSAEVAEKILMKLFELNEETIAIAANFGWYKPLVDRMIQGKKMDYFQVVTCLL